MLNIARQYQRAQAASVLTFGANALITAQPDAEDIGVDWHKRAHRSIEEAYRNVCLMQRDLADLPIPGRFAIVCDDAQNVLNYLLCANEAMKDDMYLMAQPHLFRAEGAFPAMLRFLRESC